MSRFHHRSHRYFQLKYEIGCAAYEVGYGAYVFHADVPVCTGSHRNAVFSGVIDHNECRTGRLFRPEYAGDVHSLGGICLNGFISENIISDFAHESNVATETFGGYCLICALASTSHLELTSENGLARSRKSGCPDGHIGVAASDDQNISF